MEIENTQFTVTPWDTAGGEDYERLRPLSYPDTDVYLICFSLVDPSSFERVKSYWYPEVVQFEGDPGLASSKIVLVGTKEDRQILRELLERDEKPVTFTQGEKCAREIGACCYIETSAKTMKNVKPLFEGACLVKLYKEYYQQLNKKKSFVKKWMNGLKKLLGKGDEYNVPSKMKDKLDNFAKDYKKRMVEQRKKLEEEMKKAEKKLKEIEIFEKKLMKKKPKKADKKILDERIKKIKEDEDKNFTLCGICYAEKKNACLIPCGHSCCMECGKKLQKMSRGCCCFCKKKILKVQSLIL